jgi:type IX secretion system PorP/SprF family membrane protein
MSKFCTLALLLLVTAATLRAQDPHFSLYTLVPMAVNPAFTGQVPDDAQWRLTANHRSQWAKPLEQNAFRTYMASAEGRTACLGQGGTFFGFGLTALQDQAGTQPLQRSYLSLPISLTVKLGKSRNSGSFLSAGFEPGVIFHNINSSGMRFDEQFDGRDYNSALSGETFDRDNFWMPDLSAGLLWHGMLDKFRFSLGGSYKHLNNPQYRFFDQGRDPESRLPRRLSLHGYVALPVKSKAEIGIRGLLMHQGSYQQILGGGEVDFPLGGFDGVTLGLALRRSRHVVDNWHSDAAVLNTQVRLATGLHLGFSYDLSLSQIRDLSTHGAFELCLQYLVGRERGRKCAMPCPGM